MTASRSRVRRARLLVLTVFLTLAPAVRAQETAAPVVAAAPPETRAVVAEGRAAVNLDRGGVPGAREAAIAQALRAAVEKTTGVFVSARTLTSNYQLVRDEVTTHAAGFATLDTVLSSQVRGGEVRVTVRAFVSLRPLAKRLKELGLARAWRVRVEPASGGSARTSAAVCALLEQTLIESGFSVVTTVDNNDAPDLVVRVTLKPETVSRVALDTAAGPMTLTTLRVTLGLQARRPGTNETVAASSSAQTGTHVDAATARAQAAEKAMQSLAPRLTDALLVLPSQASHPVTLVVAGLNGATRVGRLHDALRMLPGVQSVTRRSWQNRTATWELDVTREAVPLLARALEEDAAVRPFRLTVFGETRARITAAAATGPKGK